MNADLLAASLNLTALILLVGLAVFALSREVWILIRINLAIALWNAYTFLERLPALLRN